MAKRGKISVKASGEIRKQYDYRAIVIVGVQYDGTVDVMSHGETKADCRVIGEWAQGLMAEKAITVAPFQTWFGWGNKGIPKAIAPSQLAGLTENQRAYVTRNTHPSAE